MKILPDGSVEGQTFSGDRYKGEYPRPKIGKKLISSFTKELTNAKKKDFILEIYLGEIGIFTAKEVLDTKIICKTI
jgi:hypothetical protein